jgi:hypothetical protein
MPSSHSEISIIHKTINDGVSDGLLPKNKTGIQEFELTVRFKFLCTSRLMLLKTALFSLLFYH